MYERFTDRTRKVMHLANQEAQSFNHDWIGTEHILLGLVKEGSGVASNVLKSLDVDLHKIRLEVEKLVRPGPDLVTMGKLPQTPPAKKVIEYAIEEAHKLNHNYVGTEDLLLGLLREQEGVAAKVLMNLGLTLEQVRLAIFDYFQSLQPKKKCPPDCIGWNAQQLLMYMAWHYHAARAGAIEDLSKEFFDTAGKQFAAGCDDEARQSRKEGRRLKSWAKCERDLQSRTQADYDREYPE